MEIGSLSAFIKFITIIMQLSLYLKKLYILGWILPVQPVGIQIAFIGIRIH